MLLSICIPTYNGAKYLENCLDSVLSQTFTDFEVIICDDKSTDDTVQLIKAYKLKDARIKLEMNEKNLGLVANWNRCIELASGEWIKFVFQDDIITSDCVEKMLLARNPDTMMIVCERKYLFEDNVNDKIKAAYAPIRRLYQVTGSNSPIQEITIPRLCEYAARRAPDNFIGEPSSVMFRKKCYTTLGGFSNDIAQLCDLEYWLRSGFNYGFIYLKESLVKFRVHTSSTSLKNNAEKYFTAHYTDKIILMHEMLYAPAYGNFKKYSGWFSRLFFANKFYYIAYNAKKFITRNKSNSISLEWESVIRKYPGVTKMAPFDFFYFFLSLLFAIKRRLF